MPQTSKYDVSYADGRERVKRLSKDDADALEKQKGVERVSRQRESSSSKQSSRRSSKQSQSKGKSNQGSQSKDK